MMRSINRKDGERGNVMVEFAVVVSMMVPMFIGMAGVGLTIGRSLQVAQVCRDTAHMFFDGVDLSSSNNQKLVGRLSTGLGMASDAQGTINTAGNGVVILSKVLMVGANDCTNAGYASTGACPNYNYPVVQQRIVIGNSGMRTSAFGSPSNTIIGAGGYITVANYTTDPSVRVNSAVINSLNLGPSHFTYATEAAFVSPELTGWLSNSSYAYNLL